MKWKIKHIFNFTDEKAWRNGFCHGGFHDKSGRVYFQEYFKHWIGVYTSEDKFLWTAGSIDPGVSKTHITFDLKNPHYITTSPDDGATLVSSAGTNKIYKIFPRKKSVELFIDTERMGLKDIGNCEYDLDGNVWVNEVTGYKVWQFDSEGKKKEVLGDGIPGLQKEPTPFSEVRFNWIYDLRTGPDGNVYVLDSKNFAVRKIDPKKRVVALVAGTGKPGYSGDERDALQVTFGSSPEEKFDGPYALSLDEEVNIYISDTQNHVMRMVERKTNMITTIAGNHEIMPGVRNNPEQTDPLKLNLPKICSLDYFDSCLYIPDWNGDMIILEKMKSQ